MRRLMLIGTTIALPLALAGCGESETEATTTTAHIITTNTQVAITTSAGAATAAAPAPVSYPGGASYVTGRIEDFTLDAGTATTNADGNSQSRDGTINYTLISNDPRVSGAVTGTWHSDRWGTYTDGAIIQWGQATITNDNGTWEAPYDGIWTSRLGDVITRWWQGTGDYEGLTFYMAATGVSAWEWIGLIYPGDPPPTP